MISADSGLLANLKFDAAGLIPVVVQAQDTKEVLMVAWMNRETLAETLSTKQATYWSRSRNEKWIKGLTSGNTQQVVGLAVDCDSDTLLLTVQQKGGACHSGDRTCFDAKQIAVTDSVSEPTSKPKPESKPESIGGSL